MEEKNENITIGEKRLDFEFDHNRSDTFYDIKHQTAVLINKLESSKDALKDNPEALRALNIAQQHYETASMYAVKSLFR